MIVRNPVLLRLLPSQRERNDVRHSRTAAVYAMSCCVNHSAVIERTLKLGLGREHCLFSWREEVVAGNRDGLVAASEGVPHYSVILVGAKQEADGRCMRGPAKMILNELDVKSELSGVLGFEFTNLQLDHDVAQLLYVEEQEVDEELVAVHVEGDLTSDETEPAA